MKNIYVFVFSLFLFNGSAKNTEQLASSAYQNAQSPAITGENDLIGYWNYTVANAPYEYSKGVLIISESENKFSVTVNLNNGTLNGEEVTVEGNQINFKVYVEGTVASVTLTVTGDTISGSSISQDGTLAIEGKRGVMPE